MVIGRGRSVQDRPHQKRSFPFLPPYVKPVTACIAASIISVAILSYVTSFNYLQFVMNFYDHIQLRHGGSIEENSNQTRRFNLVNGHEGQIRTDSKMRYTAKGPSEQSRTYTSSSSTALTHSNRTFEVKLNCSGTNATLELFSMIPSHFLPKYNNPCWYEPLVKADVYEGNTFMGHNEFNSLIREWTKRLEEQRDPKRLRCLPYYFIAGQPKCGSSDLYERITSHPDVVTTPWKEPHWWTRRRFGKTTGPQRHIPFQDYLDLFDNAALSIEHIEETNSSQEGDSFQQVITGDSSVSTLWDNDHWWQLEENCGQVEPQYTLADYIGHLLPHSKLIVILRNPTERLYSDFLAAFQDHAKSPDNFHKEVVLAISSFQTCRNSSTMRSCIYNKTVADNSQARLRIGIYYVFLQEWMRVFPRQQFLILRLEDYSKNSLDILKNVYKFLELRPLTSKEEEGIFDETNVINARSEKDRKLGDMREDTRRLLDNFYRPYNQELSTLLHDRKYLWSSAYPK